MPGGRLTHEDRRRIAAWLDDGLPFAEIARRLGRPTSTVSREVARNGDGGYRADRAQQATARRTARRGPSRAPQPANDRRPARAFAEQFATLLAGTGLPRMSARVLACLLTSDSGSLTAADLVRRLAVSPASVSKAIGYLAGMDLVVRTTEAGGRRERYLIVDDVWLRAWQADTGAHARVAAAAQRGAGILGGETPAGARLARMGHFFEWLSAQMAHSAVADAVVQDALTVVAALVHVAGPVAAGDLAAALDWSGERVSDALDAVGHRPAIADPLALVCSAAGAYAVIPAPGRLSPAQRERLRKFRDPRA